MHEANEDRRWQLSVSSLRSSTAIQCHGNKCYERRGPGREVFRRLKFRRDPSNPYDSNCVEAAWKLGHVAKEAAEWLSPWLLGPFTSLGEWAR